MARQQARKASKALGKVERLEARITREQKRIILRAAELRGASVTDFVVASVQKAAVETIQDFELLKLHGQAREVFVNALLNPPAPNSDAVQAAARYKERTNRE